MSIEESLTDVTRLPADLDQVQNDLKLVLASTRTIIWRAVLSKDDTGDGYRWSFSETELPNWLSVPMSGNHHVVTAISMARLPDDAKTCDYNLRQALEFDWPVYSQQFRVRSADGEVYWLAEIVHVHRVNSTCWHLVGLCSDVSERKKLEAELRQAHLDLDAQNRDIEYLRSQVDAQNEELAASHDLLAKQNAALLASSHDLLAKKNASLTASRNALADQYRQLQDLRLRLEEEKVALAEANGRLQGLALTDGLTGVKNHRAFQDVLAQEWRLARRHRTQVSLILLDIDKFKEYNDTYGHPAGDVVLQRVGQLLQEYARDSDTVARYGGEEFVVILPQTGPASASMVADRMRKQIESYAWIMRPVTASFGVATFLPTLEEPQLLVQAADSALYRAKRDGRNTVFHSDLGKINSDVLSDV